MNLSLAAALEYLSLIAVSIALFLGTLLGGATAAHDSWLVVGVIMVAATAAAAARALQSSPPAQSPGGAATAAAGPGETHFQEPPQARRDVRLHRRLSWVAALLLGFVALQTLALPPWVQRVCSPEAHRLTVEMTSALTELDAASVGSVPSPAYTLSLSPTATRKAWVILAASIFLFFTIIGAARTKRQVYCLAIVLLAVGAVQAALGFYQAFKGVGPISGSYPNRNYFAGVLEMTAPLAVALTITRRVQLRKDMTQRERVVATISEHAKVGWKIAFYALFVALGGAIFMCGSRMGLLSFLVSTLAMAFYLSSSRGVSKLQKRVFLGSIVVALALVVLSVVLRDHPTVQRFSLLLSGNDVGASSRVGVWKESLRLFADFPLCGVGLGAFGDAYLLYQQPAFQSPHFQYAHNDWLNLFTDTGVIGGVLALAGLALIIRRMLYHRSELRTYQRGLACGAFAGVVAMLTHAMVDFNLQVPGNGFVFVGLLGLAIATLELPETRSHRRGLGVTARRHAATRLVALVLSITAALAAVGAFQHCARAREFDDLRRLVMQELLPALLHDNPTSPDRLNPAALPGILGDRRFGGAFRAPNVPGARTYAGFEQPFFSEVDIGFAALPDDPRAQRLHAFFLAERGRYALSPDKNSLRRAVDELLQLMAQQPLDGLVHFEFALAAEALAHLEDDVKEESRLDRARRLRAAAKASMSAAGRVAAGATNFDVPFLSNTYVNICAGSFFVARYRSASHAGNAPEAASCLDLAVTAYRNMLLHEPSPRHVDAVVASLRDTATEDHAMRTAAPWQDIQRVFEGTRPQVLDYFASLLLREGNPDMARQILAGVLDDPSLSQDDHTNARMGFVRIALQASDVPGACEEFRKVFATGSDPALYIVDALNSFRAAGALASFYDVARAETGKRVDFPLAQYACGEAAFALGAYEEAQGYLESFALRDSVSVLPGPELRRARLLLGRIHDRKQEWGWAATFYRKIHEANPGDREAGFALCEALISQNLREEARALVRTMLRTWPADAELLHLAEQLGQ